MLSTTHSSSTSGPSPLARLRSASFSSLSFLFFSSLAEAGVNVEMISTSEIRISIVTRAGVAGDAVRALHTAFGLDADGEAVVYAGTGR